jgi:hypothetical protein
LPVNSIFAAARMAGAISPILMSLACGISKFGLMC